jgi:hypothetical protein
MTDPNTQPGRGRGRLIGINAALVACLAVVSILAAVRTGEAQPSSPGAAPPQQRGRGDYTIVSGRYEGASSNAVYVLDAANGEIMALAWDRNQNELTIIGHRKLAEDARFLRGRR